MIRRFLKRVSILLRFILGKIFACVAYDKKYLKGRHFEGKYMGITAKAWPWVITDCMSRLLLGVNKGIPFPVHPSVMMNKPENIIFHPDDLNNFQSRGSYFQNTGESKIIIGHGCYIAPNVGMITTNHDPLNLDVHLEGKDIVLGENCWIGMNAVILPGVTLGKNTIVGAGAVVTKSFEGGYCIIVGNPANKIKDIEK